MSEVKGYKVFNPDWTCRGFQIEVFTSVQKHQIVSVTMISDQKIKLQRLLHLVMLTQTQKIQSVVQAKFRLCVKSHGRNF